MAKEEQTILIVDDVSANAELLMNNLRKIGIHNRVHVVTKGGEAMDYLNGIGAYSDRWVFPLPNVIFLDLQLPDLPGLDVLKWIGFQPALRRILVIVHSGIQNGKEVDALYAAGANSFLRKSNDLTELIEITKYFKGYFNLALQNKNLTGQANEQTGFKTKKG